MPYFIRTFATGDNTRITSSEDSLIVSILYDSSSNRKLHVKGLIEDRSAGTFVGALLAAPTSDILGRRWGIIASTAIVFNLGVILQTAATAQPLFIAGRCVAQSESTGCLERYPDADCDLDSLLVLELVSSAL